MASTALSTTAFNPTQLCRSRSSLGKPVRGLGFGRERSLRTITCQASSSISADRVPDMGKRQLMNLLLLGTISLPTVGMIVPYGAFFVPAGAGNASDGTYAKDKLGNDVIAEEQWRS